MIYKSGFQKAALRYGYKRSQSGATALVEQRLLAPAGRARSAAAGAGRRRRSSGGGGEREVRTQGRRPVCGGRRRGRGRGREAGGGAADAAAEPERRLLRLRAERVWGREQKMERRRRWSAVGGCQALCLRTVLG